MPESICSFILFFFKYAYKHIYAYLPIPGIECIVYMTRFALCNVRLRLYAGRAGANANVMVAYTTFGDDLENGEADLRVC
jgi:hypothetical protein